ncbi:uncharacterized protein LOC107048337 [Diachasma alloeum]|uniref:uncharacterized protein LOC107048337 n=1 Tax=Diachasma alloeum TaxID=454923 RepID=UPI00073844B8|nr:uncharacterized protein LOC107048337 [Diachasma alloeum]
MLCQGQIRLNDPKDPDVIVQQTQLGWILGENPLAQPSHNNSHAVQCNLTTESQFDVQKFWEIEEIPSERHLSKEEQLCEEHFQQNVDRDSKGRYIVALPFNEKKAALCDTRSIAESRFRSLQKRFIRNPELGQQYKAVLQEYIDLGHMSEVEDDPNAREGFYLPHHAVIKTTSLTTKVRVVFNRSAKTSETAISLNDSLMIGPKIQDGIFSLLLRFRSHQFVLNADIEKMYRQFWVRKEDRKFQQILWFNSANQVKTFQLNTVTFGLSSAPYLAIRCLSQLADDEKEDYSEAALLIKRDLYVDDLLTGTDSLQEALQLRDDITTVLKRGGLNLRQWASNHPQLLESLPEGSVNLQLKSDKDATIKALGVHWDPQRDTIVYTVIPISKTVKLTKRSILSDLAKIFDPLGLLGPIVIRGKIIMQKLRKEQIDWDDPVPLNLHTEWKSYTDELMQLKDESFDRKIIISNAKEIQLHGFCDASEKAYGACIYLKTMDDQGKSQTSLLCAKSRVAPIKQVSLPRLELCSALLLVDLYEAVKNALRHQISRTVFWSDSMIALHWINTEPHKLLVFVANRVSGIQQKARNAEWRHVRTDQNPADHISRGQMPLEFTENLQWKHGPHWLNKEESTWPSSELKIPAEIPEMRKTQCLATKISAKNDLLTRYLSLIKLRRIVAFCLRFKTKHRGPLTAEELNNANNQIIKAIQAEEFSDEIKELKKNSSLGKKDKLRHLSVFLDEEGLLRVGDGLKNAPVPYAQKHPLLLPKGHFFSNLLIRLEHLINYHSGAQTTLYSLRRKYWLIDGRRQVRKVIINCTKCIRQSPPPSNYIMGDLPKTRVTETRPFLNVGVDYCGPFLMKEKKFRNKTQVKGWVAVFVCMTVKAVHLEVVSDLTTEGFMAAFKRFIARRGKPRHIYSDNGTNFVGANNDIKELYSLLQSKEHNEKIHGNLADQGINWHFIPPLTPHFGGLWEAGVRCFKHHLKRISDDLLTFEEFNTLVIEIEAILNSRPLTPLCTDPNDILVLTPGHFLTGDSLTSLPEPDRGLTPSNRLSRWEIIQKKQQEFWKRWHKEYLNEQIAKTKWTSGEHPIKEDSIVLMKENNLPPRQWAIGRVIQAFPGSDGVIRSVKVKTIKGIFDRSVRKLAPLIRGIESEKKD